MPLGTVITRLRFSPGVVSTTYAVITLVTEPIGRSSTDDLDQRSAPVAAFASSAKRDRTPAGAAGARALRPRAARRPAGGRGGAPSFPGARPGGRGAHAARYDKPCDHRTR